MSKKKKEVILKEIEKLTGAKNYAQFLQAEIGRNINGFDAQIEQLISKIKGAEKSKNGTRHNC